VFLLGPPGHVKTVHGEYMKVIDLTKVHVDEGLLVLEEFSPPIVGNHGLLALGCVYSRDRQGPVIRTRLPRVTALPVISGSGDVLAGLCHAVGGHSYASGA